MAFLKNAGCECAECGPDPCTSGCCAFSTGEVFGNTSASDVYDVTGDFALERDIIISWSLGPGGTNYARLQVFADGVEIYNSGCVNAGPGASENATVPAGTLEITVTVTADCDGGGAPELGWSYQILC